MATAVARYQILLGFSFKKINASNPAPKGKLPQVTTVPMATPVLATAAKKANWKKRIPIADKNVRTGGQPFFVGSLRVSRHHRNINRQPSHSLIAPIISGLASGGAKACCEVPVVLKQREARRISNGPRYLAAAELCIQVMSDKFNLHAL